MLNVATSISVGGGCHSHKPHCHERPHGGHCHKGGPADGPEKPDRNGFLDLLSAPFQALGLKGGNQNDKQYDKYLQANQAGNLLKGGCC